MANKKLVELLRRSVSEWNLFVRKQDGNWRANLRNADLAHANLREADLTHANLCGAALARANLTHADLSDANLTDANLANANLTGARLNRSNLFSTNFTDALLTKANLIDANLAHANLVNANLTNARLGESNLAYANLANANFTSASLGATILGALDLSKTNGLTSAMHYRPSIVNNDTLHLSRGRIPDDFLRGCGYQKWEIRAARLYDPDLSESNRVDIAYQIVSLQAAAPIQPNPVFISYTHADSKFVDRLQSALNEKDVRSWRDIHHAEAGPLDKVIDRAIRENPTMVLVLSEASANSDWVAWEIDKAIELEKKLKRPVLCPIALDSSWSEWLSAPHQARLKRYTVLDYSGKSAVKEMMPRLLKGLRVHYRGEEAPE